MIVPLLLMVALAGAAIWGATAAVFFLVLALLIWAVQ